MTPRSKARNEGESREGESQELRAKSRELRAGSRIRLGTTRHDWVGLGMTGGGHVGINWRPFPRRGIARGIADVGNTRRIDGRGGHKLLQFGRSRLDQVLSRLEGGGGRGGDGGVIGGRGRGCWRGGCDRSRDGRRRRERHRYRRRRSGRDRRRRGGEGKGAGHRRRLYGV